MRDFERRQHLLTHSPWWTDRRWAERDEDLREARVNALASYAPSPLAGMRSGALYLLMGPRRVGKSVAVKRAIADLVARGVDPRRVAFCPCEGLTAQDLRRMVRLAADLTPTIDAEDRYWFFDEITYVSRWDETLKQLRDQTLLRRGTVVATGSSAANLRSARGELGGREGAGDVRFMWPMTFRSFARELYPELAANLSDDVLSAQDLHTPIGRAHVERFVLHVDEIALAWERYITIGGFPRAVVDALESVDVRPDTATSLWNILVGDVLRVGTMSDRDVKALIGRLTEGLGSPLSIASVAQELGIGTRNTVADRIDRLCASFYAWRASNSRDGRRPVDGGQSKLYFVDPLIARLPSLRDSSIPPPDVSRLAEQQMGNALLRAASRQDQHAVMDEAVVLVRRHPDSGAEIDFVGDVIGTAIESKYVSRRWKGETRALREAYGRGIVATRDVLDVGEEIWAVPAGILAWIIDG